MKNKIKRLSPYVVPRWGIVSVESLQSVTCTGGGFTWTEVRAIVKRKDGIRFKTSKTDGSCGFQRLTEVSE